MFYLKIINKSVWKALVVYVQKTMKCNDTIKVALALFKVQLPLNFQCNKSITLLVLPAD